MSLADYCNTQKELDYVTAYEELGSWRAVGRKFGKDESTIRDSVNRVKARAAIQGFSPEHDMLHPSPETHIVKGVSTLYGDAGEVKQQWVKTDLKKESVLEALRAAVEALKEEVVPTYPVPLKSPQNGSEELLSLYTIADAHIGMLAHYEEGGDDWDLKIAEKTLIDCFSQMMSQTPDTKHCVVANLGDLLHSSGMLPVTPTNAHVLDQDGRFYKLVRTSIRVIRHIIAMALTKHENVHLVHVSGNHDEAAAIWMRELFFALYENEPRITVDTSPRSYNVFQFGKVMLAWHHGHKKKNDHLPLLFAAEYSSMWGATEWRYAHTGHRHHQELKEHSGMIVEQHATMAAKDAYASHGGWHSNRKAIAIVYHKEHGEVSRITVTPNMLS